MGLIPEYDSMGSYTFCNRCLHPLCIGDCVRCDYCGEYDCYGTCIDEGVTEILETCKECNGRGVRWLTFADQLMCQGCDGQGMIRRKK